MLANMLRDRVQIQIKTSIQRPTGEIVVWKPRETRYARVILLDAKSRAIYQQLHSEVSHKVIFRGRVGLSIQNNRLVWKDKTLELVEPARYEDGTTTIIVREI